MEVPCRTPWKVPCRTPCKSHAGRAPMEVPCRTPWKSHAGPHGRSQEPMKVTRTHGSPMTQSKSQDPIKVPRPNQSPKTQSKSQEPIEGPKNSSKSQAPMEVPSPNQSPPKNHGSLRTWTMGLNGRFCSPCSWALFYVPYLIKVLNSINERPNLSNN
jgi:hypothetical protein